MPSTPTTRNRLEKQATGENFNTWGTTFNGGGGSDSLDDALDGIAAYSLSGSKTLTSTNYVANEARMRVQNITGGTGGTVTIPTVEKAYLVRNASSGNVTFSNGASSLAIASGNVEWVFTNGTDLYRARTLDYGTDLLSTTGTPTVGAHLANKTYVDAQIAAAVLDPLGGLGTGVGDFLTTPSSANLATAVTDETGSGSLVFANSPTLVTPALGTPSGGVLTNCTGLPVGSVTGLGSGVAAWLASPTSANLATAVTGETGTAGGLVFSVSPAFTGTPTAPTATPGTNTTQIATTAFVSAAVSAAGGGSVTSVNASGGTTGLSFTGGPVTTSGTLTLTGTLAVTNGGTGVATSTGTGSVVLSASPTFTGSVLYGNGTLANPAIAFSGDTNTGLYWVSADTFSAVCGGNVSATFTDGRITCGIVRATSNFFAADGTAADNAYTFASDTDTGLFRIGANQLGIATAGTQRLAVSTTAVTSTLPILAPAGTVGAPSISFSGDTDTGIFSAAANTIGVVCGGFDAITISSASSIFPGAINVSGLAQCGSLRINTAPSTATAVASTHKVAVNINGTTYYLLMTNVP